jgi:N-acetylmuramoyl-L-alanine amidase
VTDARLGLHPDKTRFVLELSRKAGFSAVSMAPDRIVLEIPGGAWTAPALPGAKGLIRALRTEMVAGNLRIVLDTAGPAHVIHSELLPPLDGKPPRLLIDMAPGAPIPFAAGGAGANPSPTPVPTAVPMQTLVPTPTLKPPAPAAKPEPAPVPEPVRQPSVTELAAAELQSRTGAAASVVPAAVTAPAVAAPLGTLPVQTASLKAGPDKAAPLKTEPQRAEPPKAELPKTDPKSDKAGKPPAAKAEFRKMVVIDPGHGGVDPGAIAANGMYEKEVTLAMARELKRQLEASGRYRVALTRDGDNFIPLRDRPARARALNADLFISLHADSHDDRSLRGLSVYTLSEKASDREADMLASRENRADALGGVNLATENDQVASILIDLAQRDTLNQSHRFAYTLVQEVGRDTLLLPKPQRSAGFAVLTSPTVPAALVEMGYLSQPQDFRLLTTPTHQKRLAAGLVRAIDAFFGRAQQTASR